jgi:hypothetical protein
LALHREDGDSGGNVLLDRALGHPEAIRDLGVAESLQAMHEEDLTRAHTHPIQCRPHSDKTLLRRENLIGPRLRVDERGQILDGRRLVQVDVSMTLRIDREIDRGARHETFGIAHLAARTRVNMQAQHRFLDKILGVFSRRAASLQAGHDATELAVESTHSGNDGMAVVQIPAFPQKREPMPPVAGAR